MQPGVESRRNPGGRGGASGREPYIGELSVEPSEPVAGRLGDVGECKQGVGRRRGSVGSPGCRWSTHRRSLREERGCRTGVDPAREGAVVRGERTASAPRCDIRAVARPPSHALLPGRTEGQDGSEIGVVLDADKGAVDVRGGRGEHRAADRGHLHLVVPVSTVRWPPVRGCCVWLEGFDAVAGPGSSHDKCRRLARMDERQ